MNSPVPLPPVPEADAFRAEFRALLHSSDRRKAALKALGALGGRKEATGVWDSMSSGAEEETPPLPDSLKERWEEIYGRAEEGRAPRAVMAGGFWREWAEWVRSLSARRIWAGAGLAGAAAAVTILLIPAGVEHSPPGGEPGAAVILRGGETADPMSAPVPPVLVRAASEAAAADVLRALREAFPKREITWLSPGADTPDGVAAVVLDLSANTARAADGTEQRLENGAPSAVMAVEEADERAAPRPSE